MRKANVMSEVDAVDKESAGAVVIRRGKDSNGYELPDLSSCCRKPLVYFDERAGEFIPAYKYENGHGDRRCVRCDRRVDG